MTLTAHQADLHRRACDLVASDKALTLDERWFVLENWSEAGTATHNLDGAFFTPTGLAHDFALHVDATRIIDLGAGIGRLAWFCSGQFDRRFTGAATPEIVCVERNPTYVEVGKRILPGATWLCADFFALPDLGRFDYAIGNPPFGATKRTGNSPRYRGRRFEYHVIDIARDLARRGVFLVPQTSAPFRCTGRPGFEDGHADEEYRRFVAATGIELRRSLGIDASYFRDEWHGVAPAVEIVTCDFAKPPTTATTASGPSGQGALFAL